MKTSIAVILGFLSLAHSLNVAASSTTWAFDTTSVRGDSLGFVSGDLRLDVTAWSDSSSQNDTILQGQVATSNRGLLNYNTGTRRDDTEGYFHTVGNAPSREVTSTVWTRVKKRRKTTWVPTTQTTQVAGFTDFLLFSFSDYVKLSDVKIGWSYLDNVYVTVAAFNPPNIPHLGGSGQNTWEQVSHLVESSIIETANELGKDAPRGAVPVGLDNYSMYWLVGAYNGFFDNDNRDLKSSFKLASITTHRKPQDEPDEKVVNAPGTVAILSIGLLVMWRRKQHL